MSITLYGKASCAPCQTLKYWLNKKGISYTYVEGGARIYPTLQADGDVIEGLNWGRLNELLASV